MSKEMVVFSVTTPAQMRDDLERICVKYDIKKAALIRHIFSQYIERLKKSNWKDKKLDILSKL